MSVTHVLIKLFLLSCGFISLLRLSSAACKANCADCSGNINQCKRCLNGGVKTQQYGPAAGGTCDRCAKDCMDCTKSGAGKCDHCAEGFGPVKGNHDHCGSCPLNCLKCDKIGNSLCDQCKPGFFRHKVSKLCFRCTGNCDNCDQKGLEQCDKCMTGYGPSDNRYCTKCSPNCFSCAIRGGGKCDECMPGFGPSKHDKYSCSECSKNCLSCKTSTDECDLCVGGYMKNDAGTACIPEGSIDLSVFENSLSC